jgi:hypothetical protein
MNEMDIPFAEGELLIHNRKLSHVEEVCPRGEGNGTAAAGRVAGRNADADMQPS